MKESGKEKGGTTPPATATISDTSQHKAAASKAYLEGHYRDLLLGTRSGAGRPVGPREREVSVQDFQLLKCIGRGAFGEVYVCQRIGDPDGKLYALKRLRKSDTIRKKQILRVRSEKDVLAEAAIKNVWVVRLYVSFQDEQHLYMVMEYMPGGDMISWLCEKGVFDMESTRFYIAELCVAVASVHSMCFVHRDIKPDNILFGADGHIKLSDFGLSKRFAKGKEELLELDETDDLPIVATPSSEHGNPPSPLGTTPPVCANPAQRRELFQSIVGSPGYIAPEILLRQPYGINCDWWSVGVIMYEMLYGIPPFYSKDTHNTCHKITNWREYLRFPPKPTIPDEAVDFMRRLLCDPRDRMDYETLRGHAFFAGLDLDHLRDGPAAYQPALSHKLDTRYFPEIDERTLSHNRVNGEAEALAVKEVDPRGVMFADFQFNYDKKRRSIRTPQ